MKKWMDFVRIQMKEVKVSGRDKFKNLCYNRLVFNFLRKQVMLPSDKEKKDKSD